MKMQNEKFQNIINRYYRQLSLCNCCIVVGQLHWQEVFHSQFVFSWSKIPVSSPPLLCCLCPWQTRPTVHNNITAVTLSLHYIVMLLLVQWSTLNLLLLLFLLKYAPFIARIGKKQFPVSNSELCVLYQVQVSAN